MASSNSPLCFLLLSFPALLLSIVLVSASSHLTLGHETSEGGRRRDEGVGRRMLLSFRETPGGGNVTFDCSPSGPCIPCLYSEKTDEKYRCSETGYRIPFRCVEIEGSSKEANAKKSLNSRSALEIPHDKVKPLDDTEEITTSLKHRSLLVDSSTSKGGSQAYITYRSCLPAVIEEKLSVLDFEGIILCLLLLSGSVIYFRRKQTVAMSGVGGVRIPTHSRF
ncbi:hypothetical protein L1049_006576 [Liquidambar formosana]|uniref:Structural polyprotein n=1 Tax=Liquidambar formosana TaxID=63359 RepID=A0AAP0RH79_LIQFO